MDPSGDARGVRTIPDMLADAAERGIGEFSFHLDEGRVVVSSAELSERAERAARRLRALDVRPGDAVGVLGPNRPEWLVWAYGAWFAGAAVVPVQIPLRVRDPGAFSDQIRGLVETAGCRLVMSDPRLVDILPAGVGVPWEERGEESKQQPVGPQPESTAVIQFTSGSTATPKGTVLTHAAVIAQLRMLHGNYYSDHHVRTTVSWVPFFHDLGLVASVILPPYVRSPVELLPTELFARDPGEWLRLIDATRAVGTLAPSSAFGSALRATLGRHERLDLSSLEVVHFAAETVDPEIARRLSEIAEPFGLRPEALGSTYGLAEAVLGVAYSPMGSGLRMDRVSLDGLGNEGIAVPAGQGPSRLMVSCGPPAMQLRIVGEEGDLPERHVGEIFIRGESMTSGYVGHDAPDPFVDGWLRTGDMGYVADGELYVAGRMKDVMIIMGQNYYPEDFEWAAGRVDGVRPGRCVAFVRPGSEEVALLVEPSDGVDPRRLERLVKGAVTDAIGVAPSEVVVLPRGTVEKTTSGKLRRAAMRGAYSGGSLPVEAKERS